MSATPQQQPAIAAVWRASARHDWRDVDIIGQLGERLVLRETGKFWPGVFLAERTHVRICGREFYLGSAA